MGLSWVVGATGSFKPEGNIQETSLRRVVSFGPTVMTKPTSEMPVANAHLAHDVDQSTPEAVPRHADELTQT